MANFCSKCGNKLEENQAFCPKCGSPVASQAGNNETASQPVNNNATALQAPNNNPSAPQYHQAGNTSFSTANIQEKLLKFWNRFSTNLKHVPETVKTDKMVLASLIVSAVLLISLFLPFAKISFFGYTESYNFMSTGCGFLMLLAVLAGAALVAAKEWFASLIAGGFSVLFFLIQWIAKDKMLSCGFGFFVMLIAIIGFVVISVLEFLKAKKAQ